MKEQLAKFWRDHKEDIKTYTILVLTPIAVMGVVASKGLNDIAGALYNTSEQMKDK